MRKIVVIAAGGLVLLSAACGSSQHTAHTVLSPVADRSSVLASAKPASSAPPSSKPANSRAASSKPASSAPASSKPASSMPANPKPASSRPASSAPAPAHNATTPSTQQFVVRPVTSRGTPAPGYTVQRVAGTQAQCGTSAQTAEASPVAVDDSIAFCLPDALGGQACWQASNANFVLCLPTAGTKRLLEYSSAAPLPHVTHRANPAPLGLTLVDGTQCTRRDGGAWAHLDGHPELYGTYSCGQLNVWAPSSSDGINRSQRMWTVQVAPVTGHGSLRTVAVAAASFVGTAR